MKKRVERPVTGSLSIKINQKNCVCLFGVKAESFRCFGTPVRGGSGQMQSNVHFKEKLNTACSPSTATTLEGQDYSPLRGRIPERPNF